MLIAICGKSVASRVSFYNSSMALICAGNTLAYQNILKICGWVPILRIKSVHERILLPLLYFKGR